MPMARLSQTAHQRLQRLAASRGSTQQQVLDDALELLERRQFFEQAHREYETLHADTPASATLDEERQLLDSSLGDGLDA